MKYGSIIQSFGLLNRTFLSYTSKSIASMDLSYSDSIFLVNIGKKEGITQEEIAVLLAIDKSAITRSVKGMENRGYVSVIPCETDKRAKRLFLTEEGKKLFADIQKINEEWMNYVLQDLSENEIDDLQKLVTTVAARARAHR